MAILKNVVVEWACVQKPNTKFDPVWCVTAILTPKDRKTLEEAIKEKWSKGCKAPKIKEEDGVLKFQFRRKQFNGSGEENKPPVVRDARNRDFTGLIGNGSRCNIMFNVYEWGPNNFGRGVGVDLKGIQVLELVKFDEEDFEDEGGEDTEDDFDSSEEEDFHDEDPY